MATDLKEHLQHPFPKLLLIILIVDMSFSILQAEHLTMMMWLALLQHISSFCLYIVDIRWQYFILKIKRVNHTTLKIDCCHPNICHSTAYDSLPGWPFVFFFLNSSTYSYFQTLPSPAEVARKHFCSKDGPLCYHHDLNPPATILHLAWQHLASSAVNCCRKHSTLCCSKPNLI